MELAFKTEIGGLEKTIHKGLGVLSVERKAIVGGDFASVERLAPEKNALITTIEEKTETLSKSEIVGERPNEFETVRVLASRFSERAQENLRLLEAALRGVQSGRDAAASAQSNVVQLGLYSADGKRVASVSTPASTNLKI